MLTGTIGMGLAIVAIVIVALAIVIIAVSKVTPYSRKQVALLIGTLFVLWLPMIIYLIVVVGPSKNIDTGNAVRVGALNLLIGVPLAILIGRKILKIK